MRSKDKGEAHGDLICQVEEIYEFVKKHINCQVIISDKLENDLVWDYPLKATANHFNMLGEIEKYGSGVSRVIGLFQEAGLPAPTIEEICDGIRVTVRKAGAKDTEKDTEKDTVKDTEKVTENQRKILSTITSDPQASQEQIARTVGINRANVAKNLKKLVEMGLVKRVGPDKGGHREVLGKDKFVYY